MKNERVKVDEVEYWETGVGYHVKATKDNKQVGRIVVLPNLLAVMSYVEGNFKLPK